jgi:hypothetical protein
VVSAAAADAQELPIAPQSAAPDVIMLARDGSYLPAQRCATRRPDAAEMARANREVEAVLARVDRSIQVEIPVVFHVLWWRQAGKAFGDVSDERISSQLDVLNAAYNSAGIQFRLKQVHRVRKKKWYQGCASWLIEERMKSRLAVAPNTTLNIYTCGPSNGALGYSTFPWEFEDEPFMQGVVINHETLPGGAGAPYNEGDTAVHEVGHFLGLFHTFENGCYAPGDEVSDTPAERRPALGCPVSRRSCPGSDRDPVRNFMNYSDDSCMDEFTPGQGRRLRGFLALLGFGSR